MELICRLLPTVVADGTELMATDEAILHSAHREGVATLRFYLWKTPTLSLGYFQEHLARNDYPRLRDLPQVRRQTGGAAIIHDVELTYALALPRFAGWHNDENWQCRFHHVVQKALTHWSIHSVKPVLCGQEKKLGPFLCFQHQTPGDLVCDGHKVTGSAQRRPFNAMLQHGSILLGQGLATPELPGLKELTGKHISPQELAEVIRKLLQEEIGFQMVPSELSDFERSDTISIQQSKYASPEWNEKR